MEADSNLVRKTRGIKFINQGQDDQMEILVYARDSVKTAVSWLLVVLTLGFLRLVYYWLPHLMIRAGYSRCPLHDAEVVILKDQYEQYFVSRVHICDKHGKDVNEKRLYFNRADSQTPLRTNERVSTRLGMIRYFITKKEKYIWNIETAEFKKVTGLDDNLPCSFFYECMGLSSDEQKLRQVFYGLNSIVIHVTPVLTLFVQQVLSPFYIFQVFSCGLWFYEQYFYYSVTIVVISIGSIIVTIYETRQMQWALRDTVDSASPVTIWNNDEEYMEVSSEALVPGDVLEIPRGGCIMQCDAVLVSGNCIVNESMLTGESVPVTKTPLPNPRLTQDDSRVMFNTKDHSRHILFAGTHVLQTRYYGGQHVKAVVFRTGFATAKGSLVRSILFPKPVDFRFNKDTYKYVGVLAAIAMAGMIYTIVLKVHLGYSVEEIIVKSLDVVTIAVPPALPAALTVGIAFAQRRLKLVQIFCISPRSINVCGSINTVCFDKTGTLTEEGLDMHSIVPVDTGKFDAPVTNMDLLPRGHFMTGMATCHSLTIIDGVLSGDPLELIMFDSIRWNLTEPGPEEASRFDNICPTIVHPKSASLATSLDLSTNQISSEEIGIVRQFTFSSSLQRMSVIIRKLVADHFDIYTKGAPEMITSLCDTESVPDDFQDVLMGYTKHGYRVLALAYKALPKKLNYTKVQRIQREQVERNLTFLGLIVMENRLKAATTPTIHVLKNANIRTIMVTGDNMLTALSVARECDMVTPHEPIYLVQAFPPQTDPYGKITEAPFIDYVYTEATDDGLSKTHSGMGIVTNNDQSMLLDNDDPELGLLHYHFAVTGKSWGVLCKFFPDVLRKICVRGTIFARMSPDQKSQLVENLQDLGYYVGMCGDGANDCGALKTAHAGISLSEAEASVASPFTSKTADISCVPTVIREGRCALVTSFGVFKYMACYSLTQFVSVLLLYWVGVNLSDFQFLYIDLFLLTSLSITFGFTEAYPRLSRHPPLLSLLSLAPILSLFLQMGVITGFQVVFYLVMTREPWFVPHVDDPTDPYAVNSYEDTAVFYISMYQYITLAIAFSKGRPYRKSMFTNVPFMVNLVVCFAVSIWINVYPTAAVADFFQIQEPPYIYYNLIYIGGAIGNLIVCLLIETYLLDSEFLSVTVQNKLDRCMPGSMPTHEVIEADLRRNTTWPPVKAEDLAGTFQRLDTAFSRSASATRANNGGDGDSLFGSETGSFDAEAAASQTMVEEMLISTETNGQTNPVFVHESDMDATGARNNTSTQL